MNPRCRDGFGLAELLVAITILGIGIVAVAGLVVSTGGSTRAAAWQTDQIIVAQQELEREARAPFDSLMSSIDSIATSLGSYKVNLTVSPLGSRLKRLDLTTSGLGTIQPLPLTLVVVRPTRLP